MYLPYVILQGFHIVHVFAAQRNWLYDINYDNPENWNVGHVPCETDRVVFPERMEFAVKISPHTMIQELVLPSSGDIQLSSSGEVEIMDKNFKSHTCKGGDAVFKKFQASYWVDGKNWDGWNKATPHLERVPCRSDRVYFNKVGTYSVIMPWQTVEIAGLTIRDEEMDSYSWEFFSRSDVGLEEFSKSNLNPGDIEISSYLGACSSEGCECGNEYLEASICAVVGQCEATGCLSPVRPKNFCCDICGASLLYYYTTTFRMITLKKKIQEVVKSSGWAVSWHVSRFEDIIQLVVVEQGEYSGDIDEISAKLNEILIESNLGLKRHSIQSSGPVYYPNTMGQSILRLFFAMGAASIILIGIFVYYYSGTMADVRMTFSNERRPFLFARFENQSMMQLNTQSQQSVSIVSLPQAFDNPLYGSSSQTPKRDITVENPIYTELIKEEEAEEAEEVSDLKLKDDLPKEKEESLVEG